MWIDLQGGRTQDIIQARAVIGDFNIVAYLLNVMILTQWHLRYIGRGMCFLPNTHILVKRFFFKVSFFQFLPSPSLTVVLALSNELSY